MQQNFVSDLIKKPGWMIFLCSWLFYLIGLFLFSQMVWDANTYQYDFKGTDFETFLSNCRKMDMLRYVLSPVWVIGISMVIFTLIKTGMFIIQVEFNTSMLFKIIFLGFIFISLPFWVKSVWLILFKSGYTPQDIKNFFPGSIVQVIDTSGMNDTRIKSLAHINLFHFAFILFTALQVSANSKLNYIKSLLLLLCTFGLGLALFQYAMVLFFG